MKPRFFFANPFGNNNVKQLCNTLHSEKLLCVIATTLNLKKYKFLARFESRNWIPHHFETILSFPYFEFFRQVIKRLPIIKKYPSHFLVNYSNYFFDIFVSKKILQHEKLFDIFYGYEDSCAHSFQTCKQIKKRCFYELPTLHYNEVARIQKEESALHPVLQPYLHAHNEPTWKIKRKQLELELADYIIVASSAIKNSLLANNIPEEKIINIPFGGNSCGKNYYKSNTAYSEFFNVLYVGRITPQKGIHYLVDAISKLQSTKIKLHLVGSYDYPKDYFKGIDNIIFHGNHPHSKLIDFYSFADIFVFPSLYEGCGLVILEALSAGLPVISTSTGIVVDLAEKSNCITTFNVRDTDQLAGQIEAAVNDRKKLITLSEESRSIVTQSFSWKSYSEKLTAFILTQSAS